MFFVLFLLVQLHYVSACSCAPKLSVQEALQQAPIVFWGKVMGINKERSDVAVTFKVLKMMKGSQTKEITVFTGSDEASCGFPFKKDMTYIVYTYDKDGALETGICTRTNQPKDAKEDFAYFGIKMPSLGPSVDNKPTSGEGGSPDTEIESITSFADCVKAGNPVQESQPRTCIAEGKTFVEEQQQEKETTPGIITIGELSLWGRITAFFTKLFSSLLGR